MDHFDWAVKISRKRLKGSSLEVYRSMWSCYAERLADPKAKSGAAIAGFENSTQMLEAIEGAGDYCTQKRVFRLVQWTYQTLNVAGKRVTTAAQYLERLYMSDFRPDLEMLETTWSDQMIEAARASCTGWKSVRLAAMTALLCDTALKNHELLALDLDSVRGSPPQWLSAGKYAVEREFELSARCSKLLAEWLSVRPTVPTRVLFVANVAGKSLDASTIWRQLKRVTQAVQGASGVRHYGTGLIRATKAKEMLERGTDVEEVAKFLGHRQVASTGELADRVQRPRRRTGHQLMLI